MTRKPAAPDTKKQVDHRGMMGDGTEEQNLGQRGDPAARVTKKDLDATFGKQPPGK